MSEIVGLSNNSIPASGDKVSKISKTKQGAESKFGSILNKYSNQETEHSEDKSTSGRDNTINNRIGANLNDQSSVNKSAANNNSAELEDKAEHDDDKVNKQIIKDLRDLIILSQPNVMEMPKKPGDDLPGENNSLLKLFDNMKEQLGLNVDQLNLIINKISGKSKSDAIEILNNLMAGSANSNTIDNIINTKNQIMDMIALLEKIKASLGSNNNLTNNVQSYSELPEDSLKTDKKLQGKGSELIDLFAMSNRLVEVSLNRLQQIVSTDAQSSTDVNNSNLEISKINDYLSSINQLVGQYIGTENSNNAEVLSQLCSSATQILNSRFGDSLENLKGIKDTNIDSIMNFLDKDSINDKDSKIIDKLINKFMNNLDNAKNIVDSSKNLNSAGSNSDTIKNGNVLLTEKLTESNLLNKAIKDDANGKENHDNSLENNITKASSQNIDNIVSNKEEKSNSSNSGNNSSSKQSFEDKLLDKLSSEDDKGFKDDKSGKISRVTTFVSHLNLDKISKVDVSDKTPVINKNSFNMDFVKAMKFMDINGVKELTVKIMPKELGELIIKVTMEGEVMKANITATNKEAYNIINSNLSDISNKLSEQNVKIHTFNVDIYNGDANSFNQGSYNGDGNSQNKRNSVNYVDNEEIEQVDNNSYDYSNVNALA